MSVTRELTELIRSFRQLAGVGVCFYDLENFFSFNKAGEKEYTGHYCEFCCCARLLDGGRVACDKSDRGEAVALAKDYRKPFFHVCHMGLCECVIPVMYRDTLRGIIFLGQCRLAGEDRAEQIAQAATRRGGDGARFAEMYLALPEISRENLLAMGNILQIYFARVSESRELFEGQEELPREELPLAAKIAKTIDRNYSGDLTPASLAQRFYLSPAYMGRLFKEHTGKTVGEYIRAVRIENAKRLLRTTSVPVGSVALNVGFSDINYFARLFRREVGMSPTEYRESAESLK